MFISPCVKSKNSLALNSLCSCGKNRSLNCCLNRSHVMEMCSPNSKVGAAYLDIHHYGLESTHKSLNTIKPKLSGDPPRNNVETRGIVPEEVGCSTAVGFPRFMRFPMLISWWKAT
jgi:hypothetical protein